MPSMADELETEANTLRSRTARSRRYGFVCESLVEIIEISIAAGVGHTPREQMGVLAVSQRAAGGWVRLREM